MDDISLVGCMTLLLAITLGLIKLCNSMGVPQWVLQLLK